MRTFMKCLGAVLAVVWLVFVAVLLIEGENALGFFGVAFVLFVAFATLAYKILKSLAKSESDSPQNQKRRHLIAALGLGAIAASLFVYVAWMLITGEAVTRSREGIKGRYSTTSPAVTRIYTREDDPGIYWMGVGTLGFFGLFCAVVAVWEHRTYRVYRDSRNGEKPGPGLLAKIDRACELYPEERETLLRTRTAFVNLNSPAIEITLDGFLEKVLRSSDRQTALKEIQKLAKALDLLAKH